MHEDGRAQVGRATSTTWSSTLKKLIALATIVAGVLLVVPPAYWIRLRLPHLRPLVEFITLLPLVIPAVVLVVGIVFRHAGVVVATLVSMVGGYAAVILGVGGAALYLSRRNTGGPPPRWAERLRLTGGRWRTPSAGRSPRSTDRSAKPTP